MALVGDLIMVPSALMVTKVRLGAKVPPVLGSRA
jgi:hypothetical protein